ncbi:MAG: hypothetical protein ACI965_001614 [Paraglaciecola sp.]|jgi:hypothetical protein
MFFTTEQALPIEQKLAIYFMQLCFAKTLGIMAELNKIEAPVRRQSDTVATEA